MVEVLEHLLAGGKNPPYQDSTDPVLVALHRYVRQEQPKDQSFSLLANISHEFRTPLDAIIGYSELILDELPHYEPEILRHDLERIRLAGRHLLGLIDEVVDVSRLESGTLSVQKQNFSLSSFVSGLVPALQPIVAAGGNAFHWTVERNVRVRTDRSSLGLVLRSLTKRASLGLRKGKIFLSLEKRDGWAYVEISDSGGLAGGLSSSFEPFARGQSRGLASIARTAELLGGSFQVQSTSDRTVFQVRLPVYDSDTSEQDIPKIVEGPYILFVDPDPETQAKAIRYLEPLNSRVVCCNSGVEALAIAEMHRPAVIVLESMDPQTDGWVTLAKLKSNPNLVDVPVIMMSIRPQNEEPTGLVADDYLTKPFDREVLARTVRKLVEGTRRRILVVDDEPLARELSRRVLTRAGYLVDEVPDGLAALQYLAKQRPDLILLDLMMPEVDGFTLARNLQNNPEYCDIPLIVLTAMSLTDDDRIRLERGAKSIVQKGVSTKTILTRIALALDSESQNG